jgi:hypothetical protein
MKIIITEQQYKLLQKSKHSIDHLKSPLFKYWDKNGPDVSDSTLKLFGVDDDWSTVLKWLIEWHGGIETVYEMLEQYSNKIYRTQLGSYDFKFKVSEFRISGDIEIDSIENFWFDSEVDGNGIVDINHGDDVVIDNVYDAHVNEDFGWEVDEEMMEAINQQMFIEITKQTGIPVLCDFMSVTERGMFEE